MHGRSRRIHHRPKPYAHGLLKVGLPAAKEGLSDKDPTIAELLKPQGCATGQFGKNHLGDHNEFLPTVHGFDMFFGNLYPLAALKGEGGTVLKNSLDHTKEAALQKALAGVQAAVPASPS